MAEYMNMDTLRFQLEQVHQLENLFSYPRYQEYDLDSINIFLDSVKDFSDKELYPVFREMDEKPAYFKDGKIIAHPTIGQAMEKTGELGVIAATFDHEDGGLQMPSMALLAAYFIMEAANNHVPGYPGLTDGAAKLITTFGNEHLKETYVPNMLSGQWAGTMCLTEPQAGSSLSDITTAAYPAEEGYYKIKGQKIFISGGDHEYNENFIHLLLARIEGAPAGTKGISLFVVPKKRIEEDGSLVPNDVITAGDFQKMGQRGYCTTHLVFGENDDCRAWLVGAPHQGLKYMFQMMNDARISVGRGGLSIASAAYHASLQYANERPQGRRIMDSGRKDPNQEPVLIIEHADVRRMLLLQKAIYEGSLSLLLQASKYRDLEEVTEGEEKEKYRLLLELLTPVAKAYPTEKGREATDNGLQVLGGYGFCSDFILQQYYRDIRIMAIYEGTTGIQSLDLLGRKVTMKNGKAVQLLAKEMQQTIELAMTFDELKPYANQLAEKMKLSQNVLNHLLSFAGKGEYERFLSDATVFLQFFSTLVVGWLWLDMAVVAKRELVSGSKAFTPEFYESKIHTMKFFFKYELPQMEGLAPTLMSEEVLTILEEREVIG
ncbi:MAG: acyl-CoA dehydrogenase [Lewinellaceae bacterium]|nr:acyl-CoA dehydrogenase [Phaeodactylibacter sp.]MCB9040506.1 acyl-CoA dehydrogenase [Lewinellaceae bacterium]